PQSRVDDRARASWRRCVRQQRVERVPPEGGDRAEDECGPRRPQGKLAKSLLEQQRREQEGDVEGRLEAGGDKYRKRPAQSNQRETRGREDGPREPRGGSRGAAPASRPRRTEP